MDMSRRQLVGGVTAATTLAGGRRARAQQAPIKIGVLTDLSGGYSDDSGFLSVRCVQQAASEFTAATGIPVDVVMGDHQLKADVGANIARQWLDLDGVDAIADMPNSAVALAVVNVCKQKNKVALASGAATIDLMRSQCTPIDIMWWTDTYTIGTVVPRVVTRDGGDTWFCIAADYVGSQQILKDTITTVQANGGKMLGSVTHPFPGSGDFSSFLLQAQASGAKVLGLCNTSTDLVNTIKQAGEFGLTHNMRLAVALMFLSNVKAIGLQAAQNILVSEPFYWDLNDRTRAFTARLKQRSPDRYHPNGLQASAYGATLHYLRAVADLGVAKAKADGAAVVARMKAMPTDDDAFGPGHIRADGRRIGPSYVFRTKTPKQSKSEWDLYELVSTVPGDIAAFPADPSCPLSKA